MISPSDTGSHIIKIMAEGVFPTMQTKMTPGSHSQNVTQVQ